VTEASRAGQAKRCSVRRDQFGLHLFGDVDQENWLEIAGYVAAEARSDVRSVDLTGMKYFGADGVRALLSGRAALPPGTALQVRCPPTVFRVLCICGLDHVDGLVVTESDRGAPPGTGQ
jgi:anti-anti-sigma regulatory factor